MSLITMKITYQNQRRQVFWRHLPFSSMDMFASHLSLQLAAKYLDDIYEEIKLRLGMRKRRRRGALRIMGRRINTLTWNELLCLRGALDTIKFKRKLDAGLIRLPSRQARASFGSIAKGQ